MDFSCFFFFSDFPAPNSKLRKKICGEKLKDKQFPLEFPCTFPWEFPEPPTIPNLAVREIRGGSWARSRPDLGQIKPKLMTAINLKPKLMTVINLNPKLMTPINLKPKLMTLTNFTLKFRPVLARPGAV